MRAKGRKSVLRDVGEEIRDCELEVTFLYKLSTCGCVNYINGLGLNFLLRKYQIM